MKKNKKLIINTIIYAINVVAVVLLWILVFENTFIKMFFGMYLVILTSIFSYQIHKFTKH